MHSLAINAQSEEKSSTLQHLSPSILLPMYGMLSRNKSGNGGYLRMKTSWTSTHQGRRSSVTSSLLALDCALPPWWTRSKYHSSTRRENWRMFFVFLPSSVWRWIFRTCWSDWKEKSSRHRSWITARMVPMTSGSRMFCSDSIVSRILCVHIAVNRYETTISSHHTNVRGQQEFFGDRPLSSSATLNHRSRSRHIVSRSTTISLTTEAKLRHSWSSMMPPTTCGGPKTEEENDDH